MTDENDPDLAGAQWFTSTRTSGGKDCVEVAHLRDGLVGVRDSKNPNGPALVLTPRQWDAFTAVVSNGEFV
ncbi:DUF397 domain-containing protein [Nocardia cyriacigeorgica]|uniref:DUF397 domain-containing protein n=1 Tax=Nocardia cyriacigeorgica TaxID=135487 RepID=UPI001893BEFE|nr:DUF397 domain-containing protein [Nocardia cyriacigeorgica]MBF6086119.1 DUF397 domain-containing protein [Nocardia cyriacigeorgica]MBF6092209.1 DUF397 domain-containing protein [Nocardia cyriacigeorgica]MBF6396803.1 DUF397 domain-containing protein [Nocardia cyriacigeorgica]MBF6403539.1 DUF397 domain-containing protein [Nocardia cyriacigeorgica]